MSEDSIPIRLKRTLEALGMSSTQFADACGMARPNLSAILTGRNKKISNIFFDQIHAAFPNVSIMWLLFGEGPILIEEDQGEPDYGEGNNNKSDNSVLRDSNVSESVFPSNYSDFHEYSNLRALNTPQNAAQCRTNTEIELSFKVKELESKIEKLIASPRHVTHITVYYDDSTFETYYPDKEK